MVNKQPNKRHNGFTLVELMVSTVIFSLVLMAVTVALVQISRLYYRGVTQARTQEISRNVSDEISQSIQFSAQSVTPPNYPANTTIGPNIPPDNRGAGNDQFYFCVGPKRYSFAIDRMVSNEDATNQNKYSQHGIWVDVPTTGCANAAVDPGPADLSVAQPSAEGRELLQENMRITKLELVPITDELWTLNLNIAYGEEEFFFVTDDGRKICEGSRIGVELCATSELSLTILRRVQ
jgi:prepilin-type N-terminal cleavage/methylation domain-containing protein